MNERRPVAISFIGCVFFARWIFGLASTLLFALPQSIEAWAKLGGAFVFGALVVYALLRMRRWVALIVAADLALLSWQFAQSALLQWSPAFIDYVLVAAACILGWRRMTWTFP